MDAILLRADGRGYCAGGDLLSIYEARLHGKSAYSRRFQAASDRLSLRIARCRKPVLSILDGVAVGGGPGIVLLPRFRIATESFRLSVPACAIGHVPDGGAIWALSRLPEGVGAYLALTAREIGPGDAAELDLITDYVPAGSLDRLFRRLEESEDASPAALTRILKDCRAEAPAPTLPTEEIRRIFGQSSLERLLQVLAQETGDFAKEARDLLARGCPASLCATFEGLRRGREMDVETCLAMEGVVAGHFLRRTDIYEGIRALLVDRGPPPVWLPGSVDCVCRETVEACFAPPPAESPAGSEDEDGGSSV